MLYGSRMKKLDKKTLSLSTQTVRNLRADDLASAAGGLPAATINYSICWSCGRGCQHASTLPGAGCSDF